MKRVKHMMAVCGCAGVLAGTVYAEEGVAGMPGAGVDLPRPVGAELLLTHARMGVEKVVRMVTGEEARQQRQEADGLALLAAAEMGDVPRLAALIQQGVDLNIRDKFDFTALHYAAMANHPEAVRMLLQAGIPVDVDGANGTPLICAARKNALASLRVLLGAGADLEMRCDGKTALYNAVRDGAVQTARVLLLSGADADAWSLLDESSALYVAVENEDADMVKMLLLAGADATKAGPTGMTPRQLACARSNREVEALLAPPMLADSEQLNEALKVAIDGNNEALVNTLLDCGANPEAIVEDEMSALLYAISEEHFAVAQLLVERGVSLASRGDSSPLYLAAAYDSVELVALLLERGVDVDELNTFHQRTPLMIALRNENSDVVAELIEHGADVNFVGQSGETPIHIAALSGHHENIRQLLQAGSRVNVEDKDGNSPLVTVIVRNDIECLRLLLAAGADLHKDKALKEALDRGYMHLAAELMRAGAIVEEDAGFSLLHLVAGFGSADMVSRIAVAQGDVNVRDRNGFTPLHCAVLAQNKEAVRVLLKAGANHSLKTWKEGETPLHCAALTSPEMVKMLIQAGADVNARSKGSTVLNLAIWSLHEASVEALLKAGANPNLAEPDEAGYTALHMACASRRPRLIHLLLAAGANPELKTKYGETPLEVLKAYRCFTSGERCYQLLKDLLGNEDD